MNGFIKDENIAEVNKILFDAVAAMGRDIEPVEVKYYREYGQNVLELLIWKKGGVSLDDCEAVSNALSTELDKVDDLFIEAYNFNVSSMGLDRKIVTDDDFRRALDEEIECFADGKKKVVGKLTAYNNDTLTLSVKGEIKTLNRNNLTKVQPYVGF